MKTIVEVTLKMTKEEMLEVFENFIQHGRFQTKIEGGPMVHFVKEGNGGGGSKGLLDATEAAIAAAERGGRIEQAK